MELKNNKAFSLVEVMVAIIISSIIIFSVVETYRYVLKITSKTRSIEKTIQTVKKIYNQVSLGKIPFTNENKLHTNINGVDITLILTNKISQNPFISDVLILATNEKFTFSVLTSFMIPQ
ncbi:MAG: prepilin-type N-terminal cleavage/methylation domain-containing protein [Brevinematia bacterium]